MTVDPNPPKSPADAAFAGAYRELRELAHQIFAGERQSQTLQATALVNEAFLRLQSCGAATAADRGQFLRAAAVAMRRILIEQARRRGRTKRGQGQPLISLDAAELASSGDLSRVLDVDEALEKLALEDSGLAELVRLRFYAGLDLSEVSGLTGRSERSLARDWAYARARLFEFLSADS